MGLFFNRDRNNTGLLAGMNAQIRRADVRNGGNYPINTPGMPPPQAGMPPGPDPRMNTAEAREQQQTLDRAGRFGSAGSFLGGLAGLAIPIPIVGPAIGASVGGGLGQLAGGVTPDVRDLLGYGTTGAISGVAGQAVGPLLNGAGGAVGDYLGGQAAMGAGRFLGVNTYYDPRYRYFVNPNNREIQSAY